MSKCSTSEQFPSLLYSDMAGASGPISLDENHIGAKIRGDGLQVVNQCRRNSLTPVFRRHGQIINVNLTALPLEFLQFIGCEAPQPLLSSLSAARAMKCSARRRRSK